MKDKFAQVFKNSSIVVFAIVLLSGLGYVFAAPTVAPDGTAGVYPPINTGPDAQTKSGPLTVSGDLTIDGQICMGGECSDSLGGGVTTQLDQITQQSIDCEYTFNISEYNNTYDVYALPETQSMLSYDSIRINYASYPGDSNDDTYYVQDNNTDRVLEYELDPLCNQTITFSGTVSTGTVNSVANVNARCVLDGYLSGYYTVPTILNSSVDPLLNTYSVSVSCPMPVTHTIEEGGGSWSNGDFYSYGRGTLTGDVTVLVSL